MDEIKKSFTPIINKNSKVLILGTLPGAKSLELSQYYGDPRNQFWTIIYRIFKKESPDSEYENKVNFILDNNLALWDVIHSAERKGSLDANIKNEMCNDIEGLLQQYPNIEKIVLGGGKAARTFKKHFPNTGVEIVEVPSTSPIPGRNIKTLDEKVKIWGKAIL